jgi:alpha-glucoside transport system substrate-binding protein
MSSTLHRRLTAPLAILAVSSLALVGCAGGEPGDEAHGPGDAG